MNGHAEDPAKEGAASAEGPDFSLTGPDFSLGVALTDVPPGGMRLGHAGGEPVLLARQGDAVFAVSPACTHYNGPLAEGLLVGDTVRCPWHHASFSLRTGEALRAPALSPLSCWEVELRDGMIHVGKRRGRRKRPARSGPDLPASVVIVGGGAAGFAAADMLRREGYAGPVTLLSADAAAPCDRPNLSKDYLAGTAPEAWIPMRPEAWYGEHAIDLRLGARVTAIDLAARSVRLEDGVAVSWGALLLATGAAPVKLAIPGAELPHVRYLRSLDDSRALIAAAAAARRAVVIGAGFIGLEVAASLRARGLPVDVVTPEARPMERILGAEIGDLARAVHEEHGVVFHLGRSAARIDEDGVTLSDGTRLAADLVVVGIGVRPAIGLAQEAGLAIDRGVLVDEHLRTSAPGVFAAGDIARWPDRLTGERIRVEHWVVAQRQGQTAARNMLGLGERFTATPFFWSQHYDMTLSYAGHAESWDRMTVEGQIASRDFMASYWRGTQRLAVASVGRDQDSLLAELEMEAVAGALDD